MAYKVLGGQSFTASELLTSIWDAFNRSDSESYFGQLIRSRIEGKDAWHVAMRLDKNRAISWGPSKHSYFGRGEFYTHTIEGYYLMPPQDYLRTGQIAGNMTMAVAAFHDREYYSVLHTNCEHLAGVVSTGLAHSKQVAETLGSIFGSAGQVESAIKRMSTAFQSQKNMWEAAVAKHVPNCEELPLTSSFQYISRAAREALQYCWEYSGLRTESALRLLYNRYLATNGWGHQLSHKSVFASCIASAYEVHWRKAQEQAAELQAQMEAALYASFAT